MLKLQKQPNAWSCFPTALAMLLDVPVLDILQGVGHDGSQIVWPDLPEPFRRRGFHYQELAFYALTQHQMLLGQYELMAQSAPSLQVTPHITNMVSQVARLMILFPGIIVGTGKAKTTHAVAWDTKMVYDPNGTTYALEEYQPSVFLPLIGIKSI